MQKLNDTFENIKQTGIKARGENNLIENAKKEINTENLKKINNAANNMYNSITDGLKKLTQ